MNFLSFENMFTENVNLKCNMSTDMYYFTFFVTENSVYLGNVQDILPVVLTHYNKFPLILTIIP